jgi:hypothetical protein
MAAHPPPDRVFDILRFAWTQLDRVSSGNARRTDAVAAVALDPARLDGPLAAQDLGPLQAGALRVNGVEVPFDPEEDIYRLLDRIDPDVTGVTGAIHADTGRARLSAALPGGRLALDGGGTGLFAALGIAEGTYVAATDPGRTLDRAARALQQLASLIPSLVSHADLVPLFGDNPTVAAMGVAAGPPGGPCLLVDRRALMAAYRADPAALRRWVVGTEEELAPLEKLGALLEERFGPRPG